MEDALWAQLQNSHLHDNDDNDVNRIEPETDDEEEEEKIKEPVSLLFVVFRWLSLN